jgi:hypothetical protein
LARKGTPEFRRYRQVLQGGFAFIAVGGVIYLMVSIAVSVFFRPERLARLPQISTEKGQLEEQLGCQREVQELFDGLNLALSERQKDVGTSNVDVLAKWDAWKETWHTRWAQVGYRCRFKELRGAGYGQPYDRMAELHESLEEIEQRYDSLLIRFLKNEARSVAEVRSALVENHKILLALVKGRKQPSNREH